MRAVFVTGLRQTEIREIERPKPGEGEVLIYVHSVGICGSDLHVYLGLHAFRKPPVILGHEMSGVVCELGKGVTDIKIGDRVTVNPSVSCGTCHACQRGLENVCESRLAPGTGSWIGCFVEYFTSPAQNVFKLRDDVDFARAALTEPLSVVTHIFSRVSLKKPKSLAIIGCGTIGLLSLYLAKKQGYERVLCSDPAESSREQALQIGADCVVDPLCEDPVKAAQRLTDGEGMDLCIIAAGTSTILNQASMMTRRGGEIALVAMITKPLSFDSYSIVSREQRIFGSQIYKNSDFEKAFSLMESDAALSGFVTQRMPIGNVQEAMELLRGKKEKVIKIILEWQ